MPVDRTLAEDLASKLIEVYADLETSVARAVAVKLRAGIQDGGSEKLASINDLRNALQHLIRKVERDTDGVAAQQIVLAFARGGDSALEEIARAGALTQAQLAAIRASLPGAEAINALTFALVSTLRGTHAQILRWGLDSYREVVSSVLPHGLAGVQTRRGIAQRAYGRFLARGITGFTDKAGRNWALSSYVEMATRTGLAHAAVQGHFDRLTAAGLDFVQVSDSPQECVLCRPWEGKILSVTGAHKKGITHAQHAINDEETVSFAVSGSVVEAIADGLMHPNCRHSFSAFLPGVSKRHTNTQDPEGDKARQQQRGLERAIRRAKTEAAGAITPGGKQDAQREIRARQAALRDHLDKHPELKRLPYREQIGAGNIPGPHGVDAPTTARAPEVAEPSTGGTEPTRTSEPSRPPQPTPPPSPAERVAALAGAEPANVRKLSGGQTAHTDLVTYEGGEQLVHKVHDEVMYETDAYDMTDAEVLGVAILDVVGVRAPAVHKAGPLDVWMQYMSGTLGVKLGDNRGDTPPDIVDGVDGRLLGLADLLMSNMDRNGGNFLLDPDGRLVGIDHGASFARDEVTTSRFAAYLVDGVEDEARTVKPVNDYTAADMDRLSERLTAIKPQFEQLGRGAWFDTMMTRLAALRRGAQGATDRIV